MDIKTILRENETMNSLLVERDEEIDKLKKEIVRLKATNKTFSEFFKEKSEMTFIKGVN